MLCCHFDPQLYVLVSLFLQKDNNMQDIRCKCEDFTQKKYNY